MARTHVASTNRENETECVLINQDSFHHFLIFLIEFGHNCLKIAIELKFPNASFNLLYTCISMYLQCDHVSIIILSTRVSTTYIQCSLLIEPQNNIKSYIIVIFLTGCAKALISRIVKDNK